MIPKFKKGQLIILSIPNKESIPTEIYILEKDSFFRDGYEGVEIDGNVFVDCNIIELASSYISENINAIKSKYESENFISFLMKFIFENRNQLNQ